jgi:hypothetical protein
VADVASEDPQRLRHCHRRNAHRQGMLEFSFDRLELDLKKRVKIDQKYYRPTKWIFSSAMRAKRKKSLAGNRRCVSTS